MVVSESVGDSTLIYKLHFAKFIQGLKFGHRFKYLQAKSKNPKQWKRKNDAKRSHLSTNQPEVKRGP